MADNAPTFHYLPSHWRIEDGNIFKNFTAKDLEEIRQYCEIIEFEEDDWVFNQGDAAEYIYILLEGSIQLLKRHQDGNQYVVNFLEEENALLSASGFSPGDTMLTSARAYEKSVVLAISVAGVGNLSRSNIPFMVELIRDIQKRKHEAETFLVEALRVNLAYVEHRIAIAKMLIGIITAITLYSFILGLLMSFRDLQVENSYFTIPMLILLVAVGSYFIRTSSYPLSFYGLTMRKWKASLRDCAIMSVFMAVMCIVIKIFLIYFFPSFVAPEVFSGIFIRGNLGVQDWALFFLYILFSPPQEFIVRGILQRYFEEFLPAHYGIPAAVLCSNLLFAVFHISISPKFAIISFLAGMIWGYGYSRTHNLLGVSISHAIIGIWVFYVIGFTV